MKYIIVTGGVVSGLGKGVTISSMGRLLQAAGLRVTAIKIDPYLNVDAGTMSPFEHGEVFVLDDGGETDLDLGNYERFLNIRLTQDHNITTGKMYRHVIVKERRGDYLGKTVQVVPHITNEIQDWIERVAHIPTSVDPITGNVIPNEIADVCLIEVGGTVGDIESSVFLEALRQFQFRVKPENFVLCFVSLIPILSDEQKTKPTQHGVKDLRSLGLSPSIIFCRSTQPLQSSTSEKISNFCHVPANHVLSVHDVTNVYQVPLLLQSQQLHTLLQTKLQLPHTIPDLGAWKIMAESMSQWDTTVTICLIGKYTGLQDSYLSVIKALRHAAIACHHKLDLLWVEATQLETDAKDTQEGIEAWNKLHIAQGVIVPGGFGNRGFEGKVLAAEYCRTNCKPYLGVCLGFQAMIVEYARNVLQLSGANSSEFSTTTTTTTTTTGDVAAAVAAVAPGGSEKDTTLDKDVVSCPHPVIMFMPEIDPTTMGGTMRLGSRVTRFLEPEAYTNNTSTSESSSSSPPQSILQQLYGGKMDVYERHRHRYEVNPDYVQQIHDAGLRLTGRDETGERMEVAELLWNDSYNGSNGSSSSNHPYYVGMQAHPEFKSRPLQPSPPFHGLVLAAIGKLPEYLKEQKL